MRIGEQIAFYRKQRGITQAGLAEVLGVTSQAISKWELNQCCPDVQLLPEIASYFAVSIDELMGYQPGWQKGREKELTMSQIYAKVEQNINKLVDADVNWTKCATYEEIQDAKKGKIRLHMTLQKEVPNHWLPSPSEARNVLCLAGAGGLQAPILAAAGYQVTVLDLSEKMLEKDRMLARKEKLDLQIVHGNMCELSQFTEGQFDLIINPLSMMYVPDVSKVMKECYRALREGGIFIFAAPHPINYYCDYDEKGGFYKVCNRMPYKSYEHEEGDWIEYGHTMEEYLGAATECGFVITGYYEDQQEDITELEFCVRAAK